MKAVEGTAGQPGGEVQPGEGDSGAGECLGKAAVGEKRDRQEQVTHRGRAVPALVLIRHVQPAGVIQKRQRKMTDFYQKNTPVKTARDETEKKSNKKKKVGHKAEKKEENRNNTKKVVGEAGDAKGGEQKSEGDMDVQECDISDQDATPKDMVEWVSGFDCG